MHDVKVDDIQDIECGLWMCRGCLDTLEGSIPESSLCPSCSYPDEPLPGSLLLRGYRLSPDGQTAHWIADDAKAGAAIRPDD